MERAKIEKSFNELLLTMDLEELVNFYMDIIERKAKDYSWRRNEKNDHFINLHNELLDELLDK